MLKLENLPQIWLASESPRRRAILEALGLPFQVRTLPTAEEHPHNGNVELVTMENAQRKALVVASGLTSTRDIVIGADTLVVLEGQALGKPADATEVRRTLQILSGRAHSVITGLALVSPFFGTRKSSTRSRVRFRSLSDEEIDAYAHTREPYDKAGAYAIQGLGALFIEGVDGSYPNVVGLPVDTLLRELTALTRIPIYQWFV